MDSVCVRAFVRERRRVVKRECECMGACVYVCEWGDRVAR